MKLKLLKPSDFKKERKAKPISKLKVYKAVLQEACAQLVLEGNYDTYAQAYNSVVKKAKQKLNEQSKNRCYYSSR